MDAAGGNTLKIIRVLNTNAVVTLDKEKRELIITGSGIGYRKKKGDDLDETLIDKTYCLQDSESSQRLQDIVRQVPEQYLEIATRVVRAAREDGLKINDILYVTLTDHINSALERFRSGLVLKNMMKIDLQRFYPREYSLGQKAIQWIHS